MGCSAGRLDQARGDLAHARNDLQDGFYGWACFSAQQAAEKAVKAVLHRMGAESWGRAVADLLDEVGRARPVAQELRDAALGLDKVHIPPVPRMRILQALRGGVTHTPKPSGSSGSVKVFYQAYDRAQLIEWLRKQMPALRARLPVRRAVLFGSWAAGRATTFSHVDVLIVYADPRARMPRSSCGSTSACAVSSPMGTRRQKPRMGSLRCNG
jgi:hypothetical protein